MTAVAARDVFCVYQGAEGTAVALQGLSLSVDDGEIVAVVGPSGSGKSTLLRVVAALERPSAGSVHVFGRSVAALSRRKRARFRARELGFIDQHYWRSLDPQLSARDLVGLQLGLNGLERRRRYRRADELLERVGLDDRRRARPAELSGGEQQRIAVCAAIAHRPRLVLADEPTGELDTATAHEVFDLLRAVNEELGVTIVVVTHDPLVSEQVRRTIAIRDGRTSSETLRRRAINDEGDHHVISEEYAVLDRAGRLQLPRAHVEALGLERRVRLALEADHISIWPDRDRSADD